MPRVDGQEEKRPANEQPDEHLAEEARGEMHLQLRSRDNQSEAWGGEEAQLKSVSRDDEELPDSRLDPRSNRAQWREVQQWSVRLLVRRQTHPLLMNCTSWCLFSPTCGKSGVGDKCSLPAMCML